MPGDSPTAAQRLVQAAIAGDPDAVRDLWVEHRRWVAAVLLAHKPRGAELEDLLQDVAMTYVRTIQDLRDPGAFKPWLRTVAINTARLAARKAGSAPRLQPVGAGAEGGVPDGESREEGGRLLRLAQRLPEGYREPLLLRCVRGLSYRTISELLGLPETTIETRIARGRRMLREAARAEAVGVGGS